LGYQQALIDQCLYPVISKLISIFICSSQGEVELLTDGEEVVEGGAGWYALIR
jgi:hypothetical protein